MTCRVRSRPSAHGAGSRRRRPPGAYARLILESRALKHRFVIERIEAIAGAHFEEIRILGPGAGPVQSVALANIALQLTALGILPSLEAGRELIERSHPPRVYDAQGTPAWARAYRQFTALAAQAEPESAPSRAR